MLGDKEAIKANIGVESDNISSFLEKDILFKGEMMNWFADCCEEPIAKWEKVYRFDERPRNLLKLMRRLAAGKKGDHDKEIEKAVTAISNTTTTLPWIDSWFKWSLQDIAKEGSLKGLRKYFLYNLNKMYSENPSEHMIPNVCKKLLCDYLMCRSSKQTTKLKQLMCRSLRLATKLKQPKKKKASSQDKKAPRDSWWKALIWWKRRVF